MSRLLSDLLPLRKTTVWQAFRDPQAIPHRYGECSGELFQYDQSRLVFVWADHISESVDKVYVNDSEVTNWGWSNGVDSTGHAVTFVTFLGPPDETATIYAAGKGKLNSRTGLRITNPADVIWDVLNNLSEIDTPYARLIPFKNACARLNLFVGASVDDDTISIQSQIRIIGGSVGAVFCPDSAQFIQIFPGGVEGPSRQTIDARFAVSAQAQIADVVNNVIINFDFLNGRARQSIEMEAPASVAQFRKKQQTLDAVWLHDLRSAFALAQRYLQHRARTQWQVTAAGINDALLVGDFVTIDHPLFSVPGKHMVITRARDLSADLTAVTLSVASGPVPGVVLVRSAAAFDPLTYPTLDLITVGGTRVLTLTNGADSSGQGAGSPIVNASVTLDNTITHYTDGSGVVTFSVDSMPAGNHFLYIVCQDGRTFGLTVLVT